AVHAAQEGKRDRIVLFLLLTIGLGLAFLGLKAYEYWHDYEEGMVPIAAPAAASHAAPAPTTAAPEHLSGTFNRELFRNPETQALPSPGTLNAIRLYLTLYFIMT